jgi:hypothetical protein
MPRPKLLLVAHGDHNFECLSLRHTKEGWLGHMDNQAGVRLVMEAYFSGRLPRGRCQVEITYGEETTKIGPNGQLIRFEGARKLFPFIRQHDLVVVVDVTALPPTLRHLEVSI